MNAAIKKSDYSNEQVYGVFNSLITSVVLSDLQTRGFSHFFKIKKECIVCADYNIGFEEFEIIEVHSLEAESSNEHHVLYAIKCDKYEIKGIIINPFENYANAFLNICINKILHNEKLRFEYYN